MEVGRCWFWGNQLGCEPTASKWRRSIQKYDPIQQSKKEATVLYIKTCDQTQQLKTANKRQEGKYRKKRLFVVMFFKYYNLILSKINCAIKTMGPYIKTVP